MGTATLGNLPPELINHVFTYIGLADLQALGSVNRAFRATLEPRIFRAIRLDSNPNEAWAVLETLANRDHIRDSVETLTFLGTIDHLVPQAGFDSSINVVPDVARRALSGRLFPAVKTVYIKFDFGEFGPIFTDDEQNFDNAEEWDDESEYAVGCIDSIYTFEIAEIDPENTRRKERKFPWRGLMAQTWEAVASNKNITSLIAENLLPKPTSTFYTPEWSVFIGGLKSLDVSIWYGNNGAGWDANTNEGYTYFYAIEMQDLFYKHCKNLTRLSFDASPGNAIGGGDGAPHDEKLLLNPAHFPALERLELTKICINDEIATFIIDKTRGEKQVEGVKPLRSLALWNCHVNTDSGMTSWSQFFNLLLGDPNQGDSQPPNLRGLCELDISYLYGVDVTIPCAPEVEDAPYCEPETEEQDKLLEEMQTSGRKAFSYICNDSKYGDTVLSSMEVFDAFKIGEDERVYQAVMKRVEGNNAASGR